MKRTSLYDEHKSLLQWYPLSRESTVEKRSFRALRRVVFSSTGEG